MTAIITHRGIDGGKNDWYSESSREAFEAFLRAGYGIEFDVQITKDGIPVISHDTSLERIAGKPCPPIAETNVATFLHTPLIQGSTLTLKELIHLINSHTSMTRATTHCLHLKHYNQTADQLDIILETVAATLEVPLLIFDVKPETAQYIRSKKMNVEIAASVAHPHDIERYNSAVGGTLLSLDAVIAHAPSYDWAWLDEWDRVALGGGVKSLYTKETFDQLKEAGLQSAVVSPELHATSPHLLGGEKHPDASTLESLTWRWIEVIPLQPDAICTDYPDLLNKTINQ